MILKIDEQLIVCTVPNNHAHSEDGCATTCTVSDTHAHSEDGCATVCTVPDTHAHSEDGCATVCTVPYTHAHSMYLVKPQDWGSVDTLPFVYKTNVGNVINRGWKWGSAVRITLGIILPPLLTHWIQLIKNISHWNLHMPLNFIYIYIYLWIYIYIYIYIYMCVCVCMYVYVSILIFTHIYYINTELDTIVCTT